MDITLSILENKKREYEGKINTAHNNIKNYEQMYDELQEFKGVVQKSQENFMEVRDKKESILETLEPYCDYNKCVKTYCRKLKSFLKDAGVNVINFTYTVLIGKISRLMSKYYDDIEERTNDILEYKERISEIEEEIDLIKGGVGDE